MKENPRYTRVGDFLIFQLNEYLFSKQRIDNCIPLPF